MWNFSKNKLNRRQIDLMEQTWQPRYKQAHMGLLLIIIDKITKNINNRERVDCSISSVGKPRCQHENSEIIQVILQKSSQNVLIN